jgi:hypothetical protein
VFLSFGRNAAEIPQVLRCLGALVPGPALGAAQSKSCDLWEPQIPPGFLQVCRVLILTFGAQGPGPSPPRSDPQKSTRILLELGRDAARDAGTVVAISKIWQHLLPWCFYSTLPSAPCQGRRAPGHLGANSTERPGELRSTHHVPQADHLCSWGFSGNRWCIRSGKRHAHPSVEHQQSQVFQH